MLGITTRGTTKKTIASAPPYRESRRSSPSTSSCRKAGGNSPTNTPQQPIIQAICALLVKLSTEDTHQEPDMAQRPATKPGRQKSGCRHGERRRREDPAGHVAGIVAQTDAVV